MGKEHFNNSDARYFFNWQKNQRNRKDLPDYCIKTLDRVQKNSRKLERQEKGGKNYQNTLTSLRADKAKFYRQLESLPKNRKGDSITPKDLKEVLPPSKKLNCSHYTLDSWIRSQGGDRANYLEMQAPYDLDDFQFKSLLLSGVDINDEKTDYGPFSPDATLRIVVIDDEYYAWLQDKGRSDDEKTRIDYINTVSDADADRLLHKNHLDVTYTVCVIPLAIVYENGIPPITGWELSKETRSLIHTCLSNVFGESEIYFPGTIGKIDDVYKERSKLLQQAAAYFETGSTVKPFRGVGQKHKGYCTLTFAGIPFVVRYHHESASIPFRDVLEEDGTPFRQNLCPDIVNFLDREYETEAAEIDDPADECLANVSLKGEGISDAIIKDISRDGVHVLDFGLWIDAEIVPKFTEEITEEIDELIRR